MEKPTVLGIQQKHIECLEVMQKENTKAIHDLSESVTSFSSELKYIRYILAVLLLEVFGEIGFPMIQKLIGM